MWGRTGCAKTQSHLSLGGVCADVSCTGDRRGLCSGVSLPRSVLAGEGVLLRRGMEMDGTGARGTAFWFASAGGSGGIGAILGQRRTTV